MSIRVTRLPSGLTVATETMDRVETVSLGAYASVGARHEAPEHNGVAHFLEHMVFKGTARRTARQISEEIENVGGQLNAYTAREQTAFYAKVLKEDVELALDIVADLVNDAVIDPDELERERQVILQEIGQANDTPDDIVFDQFQEAAYPNQAIGRPVLGTEATIEAMPRDALTSWLDRHYAASDLLVAAAGRLDHDRVVAMAEARFTRPAASGNAAVEPALYAGGEHRETRDLDQVHLVLGFPGVSYDDPDHHAAMLLSTLLGGGMSSRLFQEVREKRGLVYSIYTFASPHQDGGVFGLYAGTGEREIDELVPVVIEELRKIRYGVGRDELARARAQAKAGMLMSLESTSSRCEQLARQLQVFGRPVPVEETVAKIEAVTEDDVLRVARRLFAGKPTLASLGPVARVPPLAQFAEKLAA